MQIPPGGNLSAERKRRERTVDEIAMARDDVRRILGQSVSSVDLRTRPVVAIVSSSRSYSSLLFALLRSTDRFVALPGEHVHLYKLAGLSQPLDLDGDDSVVVSTPETCSRFLDLLGWELGFESNGGLASAPDALAAAVAYRMYAQWDNLPDPPVLVPLLAKAVIELEAEPRADQAFLSVLRHLTAAGVDVDPRYYDADAVLVERTFPELGPVAHGPPGAVAIEEAPFVCPIVTQTGAGTAHSDTSPLLLKASVDAYRLDLLRTLFGGRLTVLHLTRNPAGAISGLLDGWRSNCFASYRLPSGELQIGGYSDSRWGADGWWKFDAPPGWQDVRKADLATVCARQWASAHASILEDTAASRAMVMTVRGEDLVNGARQSIVDRILEGCGVGSAQLDEDFDPVVMATVPPRPGRWRDRRSELGPALQEPQVRRVADQLGYRSGGEDSWT